MLMREHGLWVVHVVAAEDRQALEALQRAAPILAAAGVSQTVLLVSVDGAGVSEFTPVFRALSAAAEIRPLRFAGVSILGRIRALKRELLEVHRKRTMYAVHLHGIAFCLLGARALRDGALLPRVICSPHGKYVASPWRAALVGRMLQQQLFTLDFTALATSVAEAEALSKLLRRSVELLLEPISEAFFAARRREAPRASVLAGGAGLDGVDLVTRLSILLNGREARVRFSWLGAPHAGADTALEAAGVQLGAGSSEAERAQAFSQAWAFVHVSSDRGTPLAVAQAMAAGVPCLVSDTPAHRALIRHGETGFVCSSERDFLEKLVALLRDPEERARVGEAVRAEARERLTPRQYERAVLRAYGFSRGRIALTEAAQPRLASTGLL